MNTLVRLSKSSWVHKRIETDLSKVSYNYWKSLSSDENGLIIFGANLQPELNAIIFIVESYSKNQYYQKIFWGFE